MNLGTATVVEDPWDQFFRYPAISFTQNDTLRALFDAVTDATNKVTLVLGAGVSLDAGYPTWHQLIRNMTGVIDPRWQDLINDNTTDPMRKAEYVIRMAVEASHLTEGQVVTQALYAGAKAGKTSGAIADAVARFVAVMGDRIEVLTTNFDLLVEDHLKQYLPANQIHSYSLDEWNATAGTRTAGEHHILHLHGILEPNHNPREPIILTESAFLEHGAAVRAEVEKRLADTQVIFIGVSLTDPNLIGPLWSLKKSGTPPKNPYSLITAAPAADAKDPANSRAFAIKQAGQLADHLGFSPVQLKSYAQLAQVLHELTLAIRIPGYLDPVDPSKRYGVRLQAALDVCYTNVGCASGDDIPSGPAGADLSRRLHDALYDDADGLVAKFKKIIRTCLTTNNTDLQALFTKHEAELERENFGLFLWLRSRGAGGHDAEYRLNLVGTSVYTHQDAWSLDRHAEISLTSRHAVARAAFLGQTEQEDIDDSRAWQLWRGMVAVPFTVRGLTNDELLVTIDPHADDEPLDVLAVGGITLNTTHRVNWTDGATGPRSVISMLPLSNDEALSAELVKIAQAIVSTPPTVSSTPAVS